MILELFCISYIVTLHSIDVSVQINKCFLRALVEVKVVWKRTNEKTRFDVIF